MLVAFFVSVLVALKQLVLVVLVALAVGVVVIAGGVVAVVVRAPFKNFPSRHILLP